MTLWQLWKAVLPLFVISMERSDGGISPLLKEFLKRSQRICPWIDTLMFKRRISLLLIGFLLMKIPCYAP